MTETFCCDCMIKMPEYSDKYFDLAVVDPPYGIGIFSMNYTKTGEERASRKSAAKSKDYRKFSNWDIKPDKSYFQELFRISKYQIIWGMNYFLDVLPPSCGFICWDKRLDDNMKNDFSDCELAWLSSGLGVARMFRFVWNGMLQGDMKNKENRFHPTQKPVALYRWIYANYAKQGYKILDTHMGSQSSRIAAYEAGLDYTGFEIDKEYYRIGEERFASYSAQLDLFVDGVAND